MRELLEKWADSGDTATQAFGDHFAAPVIQHRRCYLHTAGEPDGYCVVHSGFWHGFRVDPDRRADHAHILASVIEAIEARGWDWTLWSDGEGTREGCVRVPSADPKRLDTPYGPGLVQTPPAEALLTAYLAALEAEGAS